MEIKGTSVTERGKVNGPGTVREGGIVRVKVIRGIHDRLFLVELRGKTHLASIDRSLTSRLFIAEVKKTTPRIKLKYIRALDTADSSTDRGVVDRILAEKKPFIQKLIVSDNLLEIPFICVARDRRNIKRSLRRSISQQNSFGAFTKNKEIAEYFILQHLNNLLNSHSYFFVLPLRFGRKKLYSELKLFGAEETAGYGVFLHVNIDDERKITFLVFIDCREIHCSISTNDAGLEDELKKREGTLIANLKSLGYSREITVQFVPSDVISSLYQGSLKRIDIRM